MCCEGSPGFGLVGSNDVDVLASSPTSTLDTYIRYRDKWMASVSRCVFCLVTKVERRGIYHVNDNESRRHGAARSQWRTHQQGCGTV
jgi:hypothetical protein